MPCVPESEVGQLGMDGRPEATRKVPFLRGEEGAAGAWGCAGSAVARGVWRFSLEPERTPGGPNSAEGIQCLEFAEKTAGCLANRAKFNVLLALGSAKNQPASG